jgi:hypothetical protein
VRLLPSGSPVEPTSSISRKTLNSKAARAITNRLANTVGPTLSCARSNRLGLSSFGNVTKRALDMKVEIGL